MVNRNELAKRLSLCELGRGVMEFLVGEWREFSEHDRKKVVLE